MKDLKSRYNAYRIMWIMVVFDLPTHTKVDRKRHTKFVKYLKADGFNMFQFSIYLRHCPSMQNATAHIKRVKINLPPNGNVAIFHFTDKQFAMAELFHGKKEEPKPDMPQQLELF